MIYKVGLKRTKEQKDYIWISWGNFFFPKNDTTNINEAYQEREVAHKLYPHYEYVVIGVEE